MVTHRMKPIIITNILNAYLTLPRMYILENMEVSRIKQEQRVVAPKQNIYIPNHYLLKKDFDTFNNIPSWSQYAARALDICGINDQCYEVKSIGKAPPPADA